MCFAWQKNINAFFSAAIIINVQPFIENLKYCLYREIRRTIASSKEKLQKSSART